MVKMILYDVLGLDAALPLISDANRLSWRDARLVQTIQTNAGYYGDISGVSGTIGHLDVCVNNGNIQPFCEKSQSTAFYLQNIFAMFFFCSLLFIKAFII